MQQHHGQPFGLLPLPCHLTYERKEQHEPEMQAYFPQDAEVNSILKASICHSLCDPNLSFSAPLALLVNAQTELAQIAGRDLLTVTEEIDDGVGLGDRSEELEDAVKATNSEE
ncbi:hypothetical protein U1Q18_035412 [Sarracenia purpurea var. burkii]